MDEVPFFMESLTDTIIWSGCIAKAKLIKESDSAPYRLKSTQFSIPGILQAAMSGYGYLQQFMVYEDNYQLVDRTGKQEDTNARDKRLVSH